MKLALGKFSILAVFALVFSISGYLAQFSVPFKIESLLDKNSQLRKDYLHHQNSFQDELVILMAIEGKAKLNDALISSVGQFWKNKLENLRGVKSFNFITEAEYIHYSAQTVKFIPFFKDNKLSIVGKRKLKDEFYRNSFIADDESALSGSIFLTPNITGAQEKELLSNLFLLASDFEDSFAQENLKIHFLGHKVAKHHFLADMLRNQAFISPLIFLILSTLVFWLFRSIGVVVWIDLMMALSYGLVMCLIFLLDGGLNPYTGLSLTFVIIVATSDLIHFFSAFLDFEGSLDERLIQVKRKLWTPCMLTTVTTAIGFLSLLINDMAPVRAFGLYCGFGSIVAFILTFYFLPQCLKIFPGQTPALKEAHNWLGNRLLPLIKRRKVKIIGLFALSFLVLSVLSMKAEVDDDFYGKFVSNHPLSRAFNFFSEKFNFVSSIDIVYPSLSVPLSEEDLQRVQEFEKKVSMDAQVKRVSSFLKLRSHLIEDSSELRASSEKLDATIRFLGSVGVLDEYIGRSRDQLKTTIYLGTTSIQKVEQIVARVIAADTKSLGVKISGFINIRSFLYSAIISNFLFSFLLSFVAIFFIFALIFKSFSWASMAMIPNILPLVLITALMSSMEIKIEGNAVMLICIVMGVAVDDTIHFLHNIRGFVTQGLDMGQSILQSYEETSRALIGTTLVFICSFPCFLLSDLRLMVQMGAFIILALISALIADFLLLPALLLMISRPAGSGIDVKE